MSLCVLNLSVSYRKIVKIGKSIAEDRVSVSLRPSLIRIVRNGSLTSSDGFGYEWMRRKRKVLDPLRTFERYCVIYNVSTIYHLLMIVCNKFAYSSHWLLCYCSWMLVMYQFDIWEWKESRDRRSEKCGTNAQ